LPRSSGQSSRTLSSKATRHDSPRWKSTRSIAK
jgi:hypothetical protein